MRGLLRDEFAGDSLNPHWKPYATGGGAVTVEADLLRLALSQQDSTAYADAQIADSADLPRQWLPWEPPLRLTVRAFASAPADQLIGTAGFGFWNDPVRHNYLELPPLPRALWFFFAGAGSSMPLALGQPDHGWKAATFDARNPLFFGLLPLALPGFLAMRTPALYRAMWPIGQRALGVSESVLPGDLLAAPHEYMLEWTDRRAVFGVDGAVVLETPRVPQGPLAFIAWMDNRWAVVTPQGQFGWGVTASGQQSLSLQQIIIERL
jgi:hypothetical protein